MIGIPSLSRFMLKAVRRGGSAKSASDMFLGRNAELEYEGEKYPLIIEGLETMNIILCCMALFLKEPEWWHYLYFGDLDGKGL